jgi:hypothetical protein
MARQHRRDTGSGPSQRALRVGEFVRHAAIVLAVALIPTRAMAEVCDKIAGGAWTPSDGSLWSQLPLGMWAVFLAGAVLVAVFNRSWMRFAAPMLPIALAILYLAMHADSTDIRGSAMKEGCLSFGTLVFDIAAIVAFAVASILLGWRAHRSSQMTTA